MKVFATRSKKTVGISVLLTLIALITLSLKEQSAFYILFLIVGMMAFLSLKELNNQHLEKKISRSVLYLGVIFIMATSIVVTILLKNKYFH